MLNQEKHIRVFKKVKPNDLKSAEYYEDIDYSSVGFPTHVINEVVKEPTQIKTIRRILVAFIVFALVLVNLVLFMKIGTLFLNRFNKQISDKIFFMKFLVLG